MVLKIFLICCLFMVSEIDARYKQYHNVIHQNAQIPWHGTYEPIAVKPLIDEEHSRVEDNQHLFNMSMELMRDVNIKSRHSARIQKTYTKNSRYQLGLIAAGSIDKFTQMVKIFKYYTQPEIYETSSNYTRKHQHTTISMHQGYQIMQGFYNEMRLENELFFDFIAGNSKSYTETVTQIENIEDLKNALNIDEWKDMTEEEQNQKIEALKAAHGITARRNMAGSFKRTKVKFTSDAAQEEFKRSLRYQKWAKKWDGFDPSIEGIEISKPLIKMGQNLSKLLGVNAF